MQIREFLEGILPLRGRGSSANFAQNSKSRRRMLINLTCGCLSNNKAFDFGADPDHDPDPGIFNGIFFCHRGIGEVVRILLP